MTGGQTADWYVNGPALLLLPEFSEFASRQMADLLRNGVRRIDGSATAAIPVVAAMIHQSPVPRYGFCVRPEPKVRGLLNQIVVNLESEIAVVDDTCATAG